MNEDLTKLFDDLPEGILLYNEQTKKVVLANSEFKKLFNVTENCDEDIES